MADLLEAIKSEREDADSDVALYRIIAFPADFTLEVLHTKWRSNEIFVPKFQRQYVWSQQQASRLVESFLLGLPVPGIFLYKEPESQKLLVVDGQQRLKSVFSFFDEKFVDSEKPFFLREVRPVWDGKKYSTLTGPDQIRFKDSVLRATIIEQRDPQDMSSMFHIFERLNTGGVSLKPQEIRNCIHSGALNDLLAELNLLPAWRAILGQPRPDKRMRDIELIVRFLALYFEYREYKKPMKEFLSGFMRRHRNAKKEELVHIRTTFEQTIGRITESLSPKPFSPHAGLNAAVYDAITVAFAMNPKTPNDIAKRYKSLLANEAFQSYVTSGTTDLDSVKHRIELACKTLFR